MKEIVLVLEDKIKDLEQELKNYREAISAIRQVCEHDFQYESHNHNDSVFKCTICGKIEYR